MSEDLIVLLIVVASAVYIVFHAIVDFNLIN